MQAASVSRVSLPPPSLVPTTLYHLTCNLPAAKNNRRGEPFAAGGEQDKAGSVGIGDRHAALPPAQVIGLLFH